MDKVNLFEVENDKVEERYTSKISIPQYLPKAECPSIYELISTIKYDELVTDIVNSSVTDEQKEFLLKAATRHIVFNYSKIADYYAHQDKEMQEFIESKGATVSSAVSGKTELVIVSSIEAVQDNSKYKKAVELKIPIMTKGEFINKFMR